MAKSRNGVIINADSMQIYRELRVISARPSPDEEKMVPHRLYGTVAGKTRYSVGQWLADAAKIIAQTESEGRLPILVGGTGLYFKALTEGLAPIPNPPEDVIEAWRARAGEAGPASLYRLLREQDPDMAQRLEPSDGQRIVRALAVLDATGRSLLDWQREEPAAPIVPFGECEALFLDADRDWLYQRINTRFDAMVDAGGLEEIRALHALNLDRTLPIMKAHGVPRLVAHLEGKLSLEEAVDKAKTDTRRYAKRQKTWFRTQMPGWTRLAIPCGN